jgi:hypothetical protein
MLDLQTGFQFQNEKNCPWRRCEGIHGTRSNVANRLSQALRSTPHLLEGLRSGSGGRTFFKTYGSSLRDHFGRITHVINAVVERAANVVYEEGQSLDVLPKKLVFEFFRIYTGSNPFCRDRGIAEVMSVWEPDDENGIFGGP